MVPIRELWCGGHCTHSDSSRGSKFKLIWFHLTILKQSDRRVRLQTSVLPYLCIPHILIILIIFTFVSLPQLVLEIWLLKWILLMTKMDRRSIVDPLTHQNRDHGVIDRVYWGDRLLSVVESDLDFANSVLVRSQSDFMAFFLASRMGVLESPVSFQTAKIAERGNSIKSAALRAQQPSLRSVWP